MIRRLAPTQKQQQLARAHAALACLTKACQAGQPACCCCHATASGPATSPAATAVKEHCHHAADVGTPCIKLWSGAHNMLRTQASSAAQQPRCRPSVPDTDTAAIVVDVSVSTALAGWVLVSMTCTQLLPVSTHSSVEEASAQGVTHMSPLTGRYAQPMLIRCAQHKSRSTSMGACTDHCPA
jgi:hypothetical protein